MAKARIVTVVGQAAIRLVLNEGIESDKDATAMAVRYLLQLLGDLAPGNTVEVRVPPYGAIQCIEGPTHTRGTPPNVIEMDAATWIALATGTVAGAAASATAGTAAGSTAASLAGAAVGTETGSGAEQWDAAVVAGRVSASGSRASLADQLPLKWGTPAS